MIQDDEIEIDLREVFLALKRKIGVLIGAALAGAVLAGVITVFLITPRYSSTATMLVIPKETESSTLSDLQAGTQLTKDYTTLITSRTVLQEVIDTLDLDLTTGELAAAVTINNPAETRILEITVEYKDPELAKEMVDQLVTESADFIADKMDSEPPKIIEEGVVPQHQSSPSLKKNVAIGAFAFLVVAAGIVVFLTILDDTIKTEEDVEKYLGLYTLASVPDRKDYISNKNKSGATKKGKNRRGQR